MSLRLVQSGKPEPDAEIIGALRELLARAEAGEVLDLFAVIGTVEAREATIRCPGDLLGLMAYTEEAARQVKLQALGLE
ncbi:hypothetical protein [Pseudoxanthomonas beigongshangi]